jgi:hypothetical protein
MRCRHSLPEKISTQAIQILAEQASLAQVDDVGTGHSFELPWLVNNVTPTVWSANNQVLQPWKARVISPDIKHFAR